MRAGDIVDIVEAAYATEVDDGAWLDSLARAALPHVGRGMGVVALTYETKTTLHVSAVRGAGDLPMPAAMLARAAEGATPAYVERSWKRLSCGTASEVRGWSSEPARSAGFEGAGVKDVLSINAYDVSGVGCCIGVPSPRVLTLKRSERAVYDRVAAHLASGFRLRRRARAADAILSTSGAILDATTDEAKTQLARAALGEAVRDIERARGAMRKRDPERALSSWRALVSARWSLVDHFERDGKRFIVAVSNAPAPPEVEQLTMRERSVIALAAQGHATRLVAYELGLSESTVRVLLMRAARKLGARTREKAISRYKTLTGVYAKT
jgi:DNA-binding CsgD family transcriptional regulator